MRIVIFTISIFFGQFSYGQLLADFENFDIGLDSALINSGEDGFFSSADLQLPNTYNAEFDFFTNWAISSRRDIETSGSSNSTSSYVGSGQDSDSYAVASAFSPVRVKFPDTVGATIVEELFISNSTYSALSIKDGDAFAKKFGGESGDDPDFFKLIIKYWLEGELSTDSIEVYLADYRFEDNTQDYILDEWVSVDLGAFGQVDSLEFSLMSSDVGAFGMNTPAFFCLDQVKWGIISSIVDLEEESIDLKIFPNPSTNYIQISENKESVIIYDSSGRQIKKVNPDTEMVNVSDLKNGLYFLRASDGSTGSFVKK